MKIIVNIVTYEYWDVVVDSAVVTLQITTVALFCAIFAHSKAGSSSFLRFNLLHSYIFLLDNFSLPVLMSLAVFLGVLGFAFMLSLEESISRSLLLSKLQSFVVITSGVWILSPILKTLTEPLSGDTLLALTISLFGVHLLTQDYAFLSGLSNKYLLLLLFSL